MGTTHQLQTWQSNFGKEYTERNIYTPEELDQLYIKTLGVSRTDMYRDFLNGREIDHVLEVGCNIGNQLRLMQGIGYCSLYGVEPQEYALEKAKLLSKGINIIKGNAFDIPFKDNYFDLVFTAGVLIHIHPNDIQGALQEIYRVSKKYIMGYEYYTDEYKGVDYRGGADLLWKTDFPKLYQTQFPDLTFIKVKKYHHIKGDNIDVMFLFEKRPARSNF